MPVHKYNGSIGMSDADEQQPNFFCPVPQSSLDGRVTLAHGEGGRLMRRLLREHVEHHLSPVGASCSEDAAIFAGNYANLAMTTDSFVVTPLFFPGGDIGSLSVHGTVNDLAVAGARPLHLSCSLIIEDGFSLETLDRVLHRLADTAKSVQVDVACGDTKVVPRGAVDGLFINTTGIGVLERQPLLGPSELQVGDKLLVSGPIGQHGMAILAARQELLLDPKPCSDSQALIEPCLALHRRLGGQVRAMRDATRGGVSAVLHEWAEPCGKTMLFREEALPLTAEVRGACELLGLDPVFVAGEGVFVAAIAHDAASQAVELLREFPSCQQACLIGEVTEQRGFPVVVERLLGMQQPLDEPAGAPLPRIC